MYGGYDENQNMMLIGRSIIGIATEAMFIGQSLLITNWFINYELDLATALSSIVPLIGSFLNGLIIPRMVSKEEQKEGDAFSIGFYLCILSLFLVLIIAVLDYTVN